MNICSKHFGTAHTAIVNFLLQTILLSNNIQLYSNINKGETRFYLCFGLYVLDLAVKRFSPHFNIMFMGFNHDYFCDDFIRNVAVAR